MLCPFVWGKIDLVYVHGIRVRLGGSPSWQDVAVSSSSEFPESYHVSVEFPCFIKPLLPLVMLWAWLGLKALAWPGLGLA